jgi:putative phosphoesterase
MRTCGERSRTIGFISDTHGGLAGWQEAMAGPFAEADLIVHTGDILYHGPRNPMPKAYNPAALAEAMNASPAPLLIARGNCDSDVDQLVLDYPIQAPYVFAQIEDLRIMAGHGGDPDLDRMAGLAARYKVDIFAFGHIHTPVLERRGEVTLLNPGSPALPKGEPTVAVLDGRVLRILRLPDCEVLHEVMIQPRCAR